MSESHIGLPFKSKTWDQRVSDAFHERGNRRLCARKFLGYEVMILWVRSKFMGMK